MKANLVLLGYAGHGTVVGESAIMQGHTLIGYTDSEPVKTNPLNLPYIGYEREAAFEWRYDVAYILGVGDNSIRAEMWDRVEKKGGQLATIVHPQALISTYSSIGTGTFIARGAAINPNTTIGKGAIINTGAIVDHDCLIGDFVHIAPGTTLAGSVRIGSHTFVGANTVIRDGVTIGSQVVIGAGSVVVKDVPDQEWVWGNPARKQQKHR